MGGAKIPECSFAKILEKRASLITTTLRNRPNAYKKDLVHRFTRDIIPLFESGEVVPVVDKVFKLSEVAEAHRYVESNAKDRKSVV